MKEHTYLCFESALLLLFSCCVFCGSVSTTVKKEVTGSLLKISQRCMACGRKRTWHSQPFIANVPAGNLMMSAAILCAGALPSKTLRIFEFLNCSAISKPTFFRRQCKYLQPAIHMVWKTQQQSLLLQFRREKIPLVLARDGRSDSPGLSAKYGSYSFIKLTANKVVDFQLVQVNTINDIIKFAVYMYSNMRGCLPFRVMKLAVAIIWRRRVFAAG